MVAPLLKGEIVEEITLRSVSSHIAITSHSRNNDANLCSGSTNNQVRPGLWSRQHGACPLSCYPGRLGWSDPKCSSRLPSLRPSIRLQAASSYGRKIQDVNNRGSLTCTES